MTFVRDLFEDLRGKPAMLIAAIALLVALVAVPILLSKSAEPAPPPPPPPAATDAKNSDTQDIASIQQETPDATPFSERNGKSVRIFPRKDPFAAASSGNATSAGSATPDTGATGATGAGGDTGGGGGSGDGAVPIDDGGDTTGGSGGGSGGGTTYYTWVAKVRFGKDGSKLEKKTLEGFRSLPSSTNPILVFLGVSSGHKNAVFLLSSSATTTGDGKCSPSDDECSFIYMKDNDTQTIEAVSADGNVTTYELKLDSIDAKKVSNPKASSSKKAKAKAEAKAAKLRAMSKHKLKKIRRVEARQQKRKVMRKQQRFVTVLDKIGF